VSLVTNLDLSLLLSFITLVFKKNYTKLSTVHNYQINLFIVVMPHPPRWWLHLIVVRGFEYAKDPKSYTSGSVATGRVSLAGQVKG
jgi:hypothetical protein